MALVNLGIIAPKVGSITNSSAETLIRIKKVVVLTGSARLGTKVPICNKEDYSESTTTLVRDEVPVVIQDKVRDHALRRPIRANS